MDESLERNLDTQHRRLRDVEDQVDALLAGEVPERAGGVLTTPARQSYAELTATNDGLRDEQGWAEIDLDSALTPEQREQFARWQGRRRTPWRTDDLLAVGLAGAVGLVATWFDPTLDQAVRKGLGTLEGTEVLQRWERDVARMPIDYMGPGFGGKAHRLRSAGHDLARPVAALRQIMAGEFRGVGFVDGVKHEVAHGSGFTPVESIGEALTLWAKHLATDVVTPMSLPMPGWTLLAEMPVRGIRKFANDAYLGTPYASNPKLRSGLNVPSGIFTPGLAVLSTEAIIRTHIHARALRYTGTVVPNPAQQALRSELLLAAHSLVGAASLGKTLGCAMLTSEGPAAIRHLNIPVLLRTGVLAHQVIGDAERRHKAAAPNWDDLLTGVVQPWQLDTVTSLDDSELNY